MVILVHDVYSNHHNFLIQTADDEEAGDALEDSAKQVEEESFPDLMKRWRTEMESFVAKEAVSCC